MSDLNPAIIQSISQSLAGQGIDPEIRYFPEIGSTNDYLKHLARQGAGPGLVAVADTQTAGKGRLGRTWLAPPGTCLLLSVLLRPQVPPEQTGQATMCCALAARDAIRNITGLEPLLKWPNDLLLQGRKLAGILAESDLSGGRLEFLVAGIGINVNLDTRVIPQIQHTATSLMMALNAPVDRGALLAAFLRCLGTYYTAWLKGQSPYPIWRAGLWPLGQEVTASAGDRHWHGRAVDVTPAGHLLLALADGSTHELSAGEVTLRRNHKKLEETD
ncbi:MAG: biotin--[acetyl-CoA-carboxylase] ligase [Chloroflexi bacterium]|nr:biotin--[acetyl-CoA-carboxylase] ligase [Chloroflexota bacterium]